MYMLLALSKISTTCKPSNLKENIIPKSTHLAVSDSVSEVSSMYSCEYFV